MGLKAEKYPLGIIKQKLLVILTKAISVELLKQNSDERGVVLSHVRPHGLLPTRCLSVH